MSVKEGGFFLALTFQWSHDKRAKVSMIRGRRCFIHYTAEQSGSRGALTLRQTFLYRAASTSDPFLGLADGRTRPEPLRSPSLSGRGSDDVVLKEEVSTESRSPKTWRVLDAIVGPPPARFDVTMIGMGGELGVLGVSRVFNIIRSKDFVRKGPKGRVTGFDRLFSAAAAAATGIGLGSRGI
jgi:hypothetical protein